MRLLVVLVMFLIATAAAADPRPGPSQLVTDDCALARKANKACVLDVPAEDVGGRSPTAEGTGIQVLSFGKDRTLIRVRRDFLPEIVKAAEDL